MKIQMNKKFTSDISLVEAVIDNDQQAIVYMFYERFASTFQYHISSLFPRGQDPAELINEFFLYMYEDNWRRLRTFNSTASLATWISIVSFRFFKNFKESKIDSNGVVTIKDNLESVRHDWSTNQDAGLSMDLENALNSIESERDRQIARFLLLEDREYEAVAKEFDISVDYLYTVKNRIVKQLKKRLSEYC